jgi:hypothetical protein
MNTNYVIYGLVAIAVVAGLLHLFTKEAVVDCKADAMVCPDGSFTGRVAPNCNFAACPDTDTP